MTPFGTTRNHGVSRIHRPGTDHRSAFDSGLTKERSPRLQPRAPSRRRIRSVDLGLDPVSSRRASSHVHRPDVRSSRSPLLLLAQPPYVRRPIPLVQASPSEPTLGPTSSVAFSPRAACSATLGSHPSRSLSPALMPPA